MVVSSRIMGEPETAVSQRGRGEGGSQWRGGERSEPPRNGEPPSPGLDRSGNQSADARSKSDRDPMDAGPLARQRADPEVLEKPVRRKFTAAYKRRILEEADACREQGQIGALLRREGLYSSYLSLWRRERDEALDQGLGRKRRGRKPTSNPLSNDVKRLERENLRLKRELEQAKLIIDIQKKTSRLLGLQLTDVSEQEKILEGQDND